MPSCGLDSQSTSSFAEGPGSRNLTAGPEVDQLAGNTAGSVADTDHWMLRGASASSRTSADILMSAAASVPDSDTMYGVLGGGGGSDIQQKLEPTSGSAACTTVAVYQVVVPSGGVPPAGDTSLVAHRNKSRLV